MSQRPTLDRADVLTALRPGSADQQGWDAQARDAVRLRILSSDPTEAPVAPAAPAAPPVCRTPRTSTARRRGVAVAAAAALLLAGGGVAVAGGHLPIAFTQTFAGWAGDWSTNGVQGVDPDSAERVASIPGPDGTVFTLMAAPTSAADGGAAACTVAVLETADSARQVGPSDFQDVTSNTCQPSMVGHAFGTMGGGDAVRAAWSRFGLTQDVLAWSAASGDAVSAQVVTADGRTWPVLSYQGMFYGWVPSGDDDQALPQLIGYAADGSEVGRIAL